MIKFYFKASIYEGSAENDQFNENRTLGTLINRMDAIKSTLPQEEVENIVGTDDNIVDGKSKDWGSY